APAAVSADTAGVGRAEGRLPSRAAGRLSLCAIERGVTVNTLVQGAWAILLGAMTGRRDVLFATTVSGRPAALEGADSMVGPFAHTVPVRVRYAPGETAAGLLTRLHGRQTALVEHHHALATTGPLTAVSGLYDTAVDFASSLSPSPFARAARPLTAAGITVTGIRSYGGSRHPLTVVVDTGPGPGLVLEYHRTVFDEATACDIAARLAHVLEQLAADPEAQLGSIDVLTPAERTGLPELLENLADAGLAGAGAAG
ncbi:condensation domain-containing protein, partial [Streptomyces lunaelactis]|uniref:condensation domain-containing protein n=1 Tax=Streptomyces lunaelactis TaxID=1535768 RepID=UPI0020C7F048